MSDISKAQGLFRSGNVWYCRRLIPLDLASHFGGKTELKESLATEKLSEAKRLRNQVAVKFDALFEEAR